MASPAAAQLRLALADTWAFYFKSHSFHWNVQGLLFRQLHEFFGDLYSDANGAVDDLAEHLRAIGELAPSSLVEIDQLSRITFAPSPPDAMRMVATLSADNELVLGSLGAAQAAAAASGEDGLANFLQDRLDRHKKWGWMLRATLGTVEGEVLREADYRRREVEALALAAPI